MEFTARNMYDLMPKMLKAFSEHGYRRTSRNGSVVRLPGVTTIELTRPHQRVCLNPGRDANPFFHLIEAMAMLAGVNSNELLKFFASNMDNFSDDGFRYNAFYGERARTTWGDQLQTVIDELVKTPDTRQAVVNLWDPTDLIRKTKDKACNLMMIFWAEDGVLNMTTFNRSNDCVWGFLTGANMVHFPFFHEYVAASTGLSMGSWFHSSNNMHIYCWNDKWERTVEDPSFGEDPYTPSPGIDTIRYMPLMEGNAAAVTTFDRHCQNLVFKMAGIVSSFTDPSHHDRDPDWFIGMLPMPEEASKFLNYVVVPAFNAHLWFKYLRRMKVSPESQEWQKVYDWIAHIQASDWRLACQEWVTRRLVTLAAK